MVTDVHLAILSNALGVVLFMLVVLFHYINANYSRQ
ncbi:dolichyl-diphosphooligosaccharide--protein glycosyltransferase subunit 4 [Aethina tumida]|nr:dolichyl-diphosphooligosaccharide--protein glycosyltransferase subunit 4 [Aethina tumida]